MGHGRFAQVLRYVLRSHKQSVTRPYSSHRIPYEEREEFFNLEKTINAAIAKKYGLDQTNPGFSEDKYTSNEDQCSRTEDQDEYNTEKNKDVFWAISKKYKDKLDKEGNVFAAIEDKYKHGGVQEEGPIQAEQKQEKFEFLSVLQNQDNESDEETVQTEEEEVEEDGRDLSKESTAMVEYIGKDEVRGLCEKKYCYINWEELRKTIVDECVDVMDKRTEHTNLKFALEKWDGMVGNTLVAAVILCMKNSDDAFAFFKWAGQQYNFQHDVNTYGALIKYLAKAENDHKKALLVYKHVERACVEPNREMLEILIDGLTLSGEVGRAVEFIDIMWRKVGKASPEACSSVICGYFNAGKVEDAVQFFETMEKYECTKGIICYNQVLSGLCKAGLMDRAEEIYKEMIVRSSRTFDILIEGFSRRGDLENAVRYAKLMLGDGHKWSSNTYAALIDVYGRGGRVEEAYELYMKMSADRTQNVFDRIVRVLKQDTRRLREAYEVVKTMIRSGYTPEPESFHYVVTRLGESGELFKCIEKSKKDVDRRACDEFVAKLCESKDLTHAVEFYKVMVKRGMPLQSTTFRVLFTGLCEVGSVDAAYELFEKLESMNVEYDEETHKMAFERMCDAKKVNEAYKIYGIMVKRSLSTDEGMMKRLVVGFCECGDGIRGVKVYDAMRRRGFYVDEESCRVLIATLSKMGEMVAAEKIASDMIEKSLFSSSRSQAL